LALPLFVYVKYFLPKWTVGKSAHPLSWAMRVVSGKLEFNQFK
jgi:hypothetical protein